jgi:hypothetical protein
MPMYIHMHKSFNNHASFPGNPSQHQQQMMNSETPDPKVDDPQWHGSSCTTLPARRHSCLHGMHVIHASMSHGCGHERDHHIRPSPVISYPPAQAPEALPKTSCINFLLLHTQPHPPLFSDPGILGTGISLYNSLSVQGSMRCA